MSEIKWQEPPADGRSRGAWDKTAKALKERPGQWALVRENADPSHATRIKHGTLPCFMPRGSFEATVRKADGGKWDIYARYVGEGPQ